MKEPEIKKLIAKINLWQSIPLKHRKVLTREIVSDEAYLGTESHQEAYRSAVQAEDEPTLGRLRKQGETRRRKALKWLTENGY